MFEAHIADLGGQDGLSEAQVSLWAQVRAAIAASGTVAALLDGLEELHDKFDQKLSALAYLNFRNAISEADKEAVAVAIRRPILRGHYHPICAEWESAIEALTRDPDSELPEA